MKKSFIFFLISVLGILLLTILVNFQNPSIQGKVFSIKVTDKATSIKLENSSETIVILNKTVLNIKAGKEIKVYGQKQTEKNSTTIFADKIICLDC